MSHEFDTYAALGPGYDGPLHAPHGAINPNDYAHAHDYQQALGAQHALDEYAAWSIGPGTPVGGGRCPECQPLPVFAGQAERRRPTRVCSECQREIDARTASKRAAYLRLPSVDEATFRRFLRGQAPHIVDGETHHFYNWTGARVAHLLDEALAEADPDRTRWAGTLCCIDPAGGPASKFLPGDGDAYLLPSGEVVTRRLENRRDSFERIEVPYPPELRWAGSSDTHWVFYVRARPGDRFNSRWGTWLPDEQCFSYQEINDLPRLVREARRSVVARREHAEQARVEELMKARQDRRDTIKMVIYWLLILAAVAAVVAGLVWASHAIPHR